MQDVIQRLFGSMPMMCCGSDLFHDLPLGDDHHFVDRDTMFFLEANLRWVVLFINKAPVTESARIIQESLLIIGIPSCLVLMPGLHCTSITVAHNHPGFFSSVFSKILQQMWFVEW